MPSNLRIISCPDFVRYDASGAFDAEATRAALREIAAQCVATGVRDAMLDVRDITDAPTVTQLFWIAERLHEIGFACLSRLAIVYTDHGGGRATFFATTAQNRGFNIRVFTDFEEAFNWLSTSVPVTE